MGGEGGGGGGRVLAASHSFSDHNMTIRGEEGGGGRGVEGV